MRDFAIPHDPIDGWPTAKRLRPDDVSILRLIVERLDRLPDQFRWAQVASDRTACLRLEGEQAALTDLLKSIHDRVYQTGATA